MAGETKLDLVHYEINMLYSMAARLAVPSSPPSWAEGNAWMESFCIHARNLLDFFRVNTRADGKSLPQPRFKNTAITAECFYPLWGECKPPSTIFATIRNAYDELSIMVAHLSDERLPLLGKQWPVRELTDYLDDLRIDFEQKVEVAKLSPRWRRDPLCSPFPKGNTPLNARIMDGTYEVPSE